MAVNWSPRVNTKFYAMSAGAKENIEETEFESGIVRTNLKSSSMRRRFTVSFPLRSREEENFFWDWYDNTLLSRTQNFVVTDFVRRDRLTEYRMTGEPDVDGSQYPKKATIEVEEA